MSSGLTGGKVIQMWRIRPGPWILARTTFSPTAIILLGEPLRPLAALPPAPRSPVGFSKLIERESRPVSIRAGVSNGNTGNALVRRAWSRCEGRKAGPHDHAAG